MDCRFSVGRSESVKPCISSPTPIDLRVESAGAPPFVHFKGWGLDSGTTGEYVDGWSEKSPPLQKPQGWGTRALATSLALREGRYYQISGCTRPCLQASRATPAYRNRMAVSAEETC